MNILQRVRIFAKRAAKVGTKWHTKKTGEIICANGHCTLGALAWAQTAEGRAEQEALRKEYQAFVAQLGKRAAKAGIALNASVDYDPIYDGFETDAKSFDGFPAAEQAADQVPGLAESVAEVIVLANDHNRKQLLEKGYNKESNPYRARLILEEVLLGKKAK